MFFFLPNRQQVTDIRKQLRPFSPIRVPSSLSSFLTQHNKFTRRLEFCKIEGNYFAIPEMIF